MERVKELKLIALLLIGTTLITATCQAGGRYIGYGYHYDYYDINGHRRLFKVTLIVDTGFHAGRYVIVKWEGHKDSWYNLGGSLWGRFMTGKVHVWDNHGFDKTFWFDFDEYTGEIGWREKPAVPSTVHARVSWQYWAPWGLGIYIFWQECEASVYVPN